MWYILTALVFSVVLVGAYELLYAKYSGETVPAPDIPRSEQMYGKSANELRYMVMGDSTGVGQGAVYSESVAVKTAEYLAKGYTVRLTNVAVSGATTRDVLHEQVPKVVAQNPDLVLIAAGANDVIKFTNLTAVRRDMTEVITILQRQNPNVKIVLTGAPQVGAVPRFLWPLSSLAELRTAQVNRVIVKLAQAKNVAFVPIAKKTGHLFKAQPDLFAKDNFHPNKKGYATWVPVLNQQLQGILTKK